MRKVILAAVVAMALMTVPAAADIVIFEQSPADGNQALISDTGYGQLGYDDFVLAPGASTVTDIHWWGTYGDDPDPAATDDFTIFFYDTNGGSAIASYTVGAASRTATAMTASVWNDHDGGPVYEYSYDLASALNLTAGSTYYLSIVNSTASTWGWLEDGPGNSFFGTGGSWSSTGSGNDLAFALTGPDVVPEPATLSLLGLGLGGLVLRRTRRKA